jgi:hypothetical protein
VAIPLTSESAAAAAALIDGDQMLSVELRKGDPTLVALVREGDPTLVALVREAEDIRGRGGQEGQAGRVLQRCLRLRHRRLRATSGLPDV